MTQLTSISQLGGKTIREGGAAILNVGDDDHPVLVFRFTDDTFVRVEPYLCSLGSVRIDITEPPEDDYERVDIGLMTQEEADANRATEVAEYARQQSEQNEARDRAEYERLRAKYEGATK